MKNRLGVEPLSLREGVILTLAAVGVFCSTLAALNVTTVSTGEMAIWPSDAITLAMMLLMKRRPVLALLACRVASATVSFAIAFPLLPALAVNIASVLGIIFVYLALNRLKKRQMYEVRGLVVFFCLAAIGSGISAPLQGLALSFFDKTPFLPVFESCFAANLIGMAVIVPTMVLIFDHEPLFRGVQKRRIEKIRAFVVYTFGVFLVFYIKEMPLLFLVPMGLVGVAYVADVGTVAFSVLATAVIASVATVLGYGRFTVTHATPSAQLLMLQVFLGIVTLFALPTAALIWEHRRLKESLIAAKVDAEAASSAKSRFLAMISHEIRTPLNGILGMAQIMAMNALHPEQAERLKVIRRSGEILLSILNDVLDLSKIEAGKLELETIEFDLKEVLHSTSHCYSPLAGEKGLVYKQDIESVAGIYQGDPTRLRQIFSNLLSNALKFTEAGAISISAEHADGTLRLSVADTGIGIPPAQLDKLFAKFTQADETTTRRFGGTGLGLSICRDLAVLMGGSIEVKSEEGAGSCFTAVIPLIRVGDVTMPEPDADVMNAAIGAGVRVLAAEDNATNQLVLRTLLEMAEFEVCIVSNGEEAIVRWEEQDWDLILMDVQMPVMDGPEATRAIRAREAASGRARTPILALTANTMAHQVYGYIADGMDGHIAKPIDAEALFRSILEVMGKTASLDAPSGFDMDHEPVAASEIRAP